jgi:hypothetical protein
LRRDDDKEGRKEQKHAVENEVKKQTSTSSTLMEKVLSGLITTVQHGTTGAKQQMSQQRANAWGKRTEGKKVPAMVAEQ